MQPRDAVRWSQQEEVLKQTEEGRAFLDGFTFWLNAAEKLRDEDPNFPPYDAMQKGLIITVEQFGPIRTEAMSDMLMVAVNFWEHGVELAEGMTPVETAMVHEAVFRATERLEAMAAEGA